MNGCVARCWFWHNVLCTLAATATSLLESGIAKRQMSIYIPAPARRAPYPSSARYDLCRYVYINRVLPELRLISGIILQAHDNSINNK